MKCSVSNCKASADHMDDYGNLLCDDCYGYLVARVDTPTWRDRRRAKRDAKREAKRIRLEQQSAWDDLMNERWGRGNKWPRETDS